MAAAKDMWLKDSQWIKVRQLHVQTNKFDMCRSLKATGIVF